MHLPKVRFFLRKMACIAICLCLSIYVYSPRAAAQAPSIVDIVYEDPLLETTSASTLKWSITFSQPVLTPTPSDFIISENASGATVTSVMAITASGSQSYVVTASGHNNSYSGSITLEVAGSNSITNQSGVPLSSTFPTGDVENTYLIQQPGPKLLSVLRQSPTNINTAADALVFRLSFDQAIANLDTSDFKLIDETTGADISGVNAAVSQIGTSNVYDLSFTGIGLANLNAEVSLVPTLSLDVKNLSQTSNLEIGADVSPLETSFILDNVAPSVSISSTATAPITTMVPVTFLVSEANTTFSQSDVSVTNATLSGFSGSGTAFNAFVTPASNGSSNLSLTINANTFTDAAGLANIASAPLNLSIGSIRPTPSFSLSGGNSAQTAVFSVSIDTQATTTDFAQSDISISSGTVTGFTGSGQNYTASITPPANSEGAISLNIAEGAYVDNNQNSNLAANALTIAYDTKAPAVSISGPSTTQSGPFPISLTMTEIVSGFDVSDLSVTNGSISNLAGNGLNYTATLTPDTATNGTISLGVTPNSFSDLAGNLNMGSSQYSVQVNTTAPTVAITSVANGTLSQPTLINFVLSHPSSDFSITDISVSGGTLSNLSGSQNTYSALFTPNPNSTSPGLISVPVNAFSSISDPANTNQASQPLALVIDTVSPTVIVSGPNTSQSGAFDVSFVFSEPPIGFTANSITIANGSLTNLAGSGTTYTARVTPINGSGTISLNVLSGHFQDQNGNNNLPSNPFTVAFDTQAPRLQSIKRLDPISETTTGTSLTFRVHFSEVVSPLAVNDFQVTGPTGTSISLSTTSANFVDVRVSGGDLATYTGTVRLELATNPSLGDLTGNALTNINAIGEVQTFARVSDTTAPSIKISASNASCSEAFSVTFTFSEAVTGFSDSDIESSNASVSNFSTSNPQSYSAIISPTSLAATGGYKLAIYVAANAASDAAGNLSIAAETFELTCQNSLRIQSETRSFIAEQLQARSELLTTHSPRLTSRFRDLRRRKTLKSDRSDFYQSQSIPDPVDLHVKAEFSNGTGDDQALVNFDSSHNRITNFVTGANGTSPKNSKTDLWVKARWAMNKTEDRDTKSGLAYVGVDYQLSPKTMLGVLGQYDWSDAKDRKENYSVAAKGWMLGPYLVSEIRDDFYFDARVAWGKAKNKIKPNNTFEDEFGSKRWLVSTSLSGRIAGKGSLEAYSVKPELSFKHFGETQDDYIDNNGVNIPKTKAGITRLSFGPLLQRDVLMSNDTRLTIETGIKGVFTSSTSGTLDTRDQFSEIRSNSLSARLETRLGWDWDLGYGVRSLELDSFVDGVGKKNSQTYGFGFRFRQPF